MMRALFSGVSGLKSHQTRMDVIGNNIANVNTVAYKSQSMTFSEVFYQTTQTATGPNLGSSVGSISTAMTTEGATERTDNATDLAITGCNAFFIVSSGGNTYFTRAGNFTKDESGALVTQSGASVLGWQVDSETGEILKDKVSPLYLESDAVKYTLPERTTGLTLAGNINSTESDDVTTTLNFYDSLGSLYQATVVLHKEGQTGNDVTYSITASSITKDGEKTDLTLTTSNTLVFNSVTGLSNEANANIEFTVESPTANDPQLDNIGAEGTHILTVDMSGIKMLADKSSIKQTYGIKDATTGNYIDTMGRINASYSNGDVKTIGQIAVTEFTNPGGLEKVGENLYAATLNSGEFDGIGKDISATKGKIQPGALEMSNVDLAQEFTTMITTQRGYQANSRIITVSDTLLEELINLKR